MIISKFIFHLSEDPKTIHSGNLRCGKNHVYSNQNPIILVLFLIGDFGNASPYSGQHFRNFFDSYINLINLY